MLKASQLVAHRGLQVSFPENTLLSIREAISEGALHVECDVLLSSDGEFFLCHDRHLERIAGMNAYINELSSKELKKISCHEPKRLGHQFVGLNFTSLSTLCALICEHPEVHFYIELKRGALISHGLDYCLNRLGEQLAGFNNVTVISYDRQAMKLAKSHGIKRAGIVLEHWHNQAEVINYCEVDIAYINVERLHGIERIEAAAPIALYEIAQADIAKHWLDHGASLIESFDVKTLLNHSS